MSVCVLYVAGVAHSGTTLLTRVLGAVDGLFAAGEVYGLADRLASGDACGCGAPLAECPFWSRVVESADPPRTERRWIQARTLPALMLGRDRACLRAYRERLTALYRAIAAVSGCRVIVDSSKSPTYAYILRGAPSIDLRMVHLVRDPLATSYSWSVDPHYHRTRGPAFGARWSLWNLELETASSVRLRLEDFARDPAAETRRVLRLVGAEDAELPFVDGNAVALPEHHLIGGDRSRFDTGVIAIRPSTRWESNLSRRRELTTAVAAMPLQLLYGYRIRRRR